MSENPEPISPAPRPRRRQFPLYAKILSWFFLNLLLVGIGVWIVTQQQFRVGFDSLLVGSAAGERVKGLAELLSQELLEEPPETWTALLARYERAYPLHIYAFSDGGAQIAGSPVQLPAEVQTRLVKEGRPPRAEPGDERRPRRGGQRGDLRPPRPEGDWEPPPPPPPPREGRGPGERRPPSLGGLIRAGEPPGYWILVRMALPPETVRNGPVTLVLASETLSAGGFLLDLKPLWWVGAAALVFSLLFWLPLVRSITRSVGAMRDATAEIAEGRFEGRVDAQRRDELGALGSSINHMAERLAGLINGQRRFLSDVAHELCAPLARLQMALGILEDRVSAESGGAGLRSRIGDVREEVDHMAGLVNELLSFSKASFGSKHVRLGAVAVHEVLEKAARREGNGEVPVEIACDPALYAEADPELLGRAVGNLLRNSIRYASQGGPITLFGEGRDGEVTITVADRGPGVPAEALPQLFDPFYRVDTARTRETGGVGLGLTIAKTCVDACGGTIRASNAVGGGLEISIRVRAAGNTPAPAELKRLMPA